MTRPPKQPGYYYICPSCRNPTSTQCRKGKPVRCTKCIDKDFEQMAAKRKARQEAREEKVRIELARIAERMGVRTEEREAIRLARVARRKLTRKKWLARQPDKPKKPKAVKPTGDSRMEPFSQYALALVAGNDTDAPELHDSERRGPDHIMDALRQVSQESGVPIEGFAYKYDRSEGYMAQLNRRAYALAAQAAGIKVLPEYQVADVPCLVYGPSRKKISEQSAQTLRAVHETVRTLETGTCNDVARHSGLPVSTVKNRIRRLHNMSLVREAPQRDSGTSIVWAVTETAFDDVFDVQVPSIGPVDDRAVAA